MHGLDCSYRLAFPICIVASPGAHHQDTRHISHHAITHPDITVVQGVKVISLLQTLFDLAACQPLRYALGSGLCAPQRPRERIRAPGVSLQREILTQPRRRRARVRACRSACRERRRIRGRGMLHDAGCPPDDIQVEFPCLDHPGRKHRSDFLWKREDGSVIVGEFDGVRKYVDPHMTSGREIREVVDEERKRQQCMSQYAIGMVRMYYRDLDNPDESSGSSEIWAYNHDTRDVGARAALVTHTCGKQACSSATRLSPERPTVIAATPFQAPISAAMRQNTRVEIAVIRNSPCQMVVLGLKTAISHGNCRNRLFQPVMYRCTRGGWGGPRRVMWCLMREA